MKSSENYLEELIYMKREPMILDVLSKKKTLTSKEEYIYGIALRNLGVCGYLSHLEKAFLKNKQNRLYSTTFIVELIKMDLLHNSADIRKMLEGCFGRARDESLLFSLVQLYRNYLLKGQKKNPVFRRKFFEILEIFFEESLKEAIENCH